MKMIPTLIHGILDYVCGLALLLLPNLFGFAGGGGAVVWIPRVIGIVVLLQSLATQYELGVIKLLPMKMHLQNDYVASVFLAASPWLFGFADQSMNVWVPHVVFGLAILGTSLMTKETAPKRARA
jgi:SPW repeat-containing protein